MADRRAIRLVHVVDHPIHYFAPLYLEISRHPEVDLKALFWNTHGSRRQWERMFGKVFRWDFPLLEDYQYEFLFGDRGILPVKVRRLLEHIRPERCDVVWVHGYTPNYSLLTAFAARQRGIPFLLREEANLLDPRPYWRRALKRPLLSWLCSWAYGLYIGTHNKEFYRHYGMPEEHLFPAPYCANNAFFQDQSRVLGQRRRELRIDFGLPPHLPTVLFAGKLEPKKNPLLLVEAVAAIQGHYPCSLMYAGDGPLRESVEKRASQLGLSHMIITGFLNQTEICRAYAAADVFVLPSAFKETWGMVVNEAMNFGLPIIASDRVGCASDLVRPGENGYVFPSGDIEALADALRQLVGDPERRRRLGERSVQIVQHFSIERTAKGIIAAALAATRSDRRIAS